MALERKKSDCSHNASECFLQKRSSRHSLESRTCGCDDLEKLRYELEKETINRLLYLDFVYSNPCDYDPLTLFLI